MTLVCPAVTHATFGVLIVPRVVSTPVTIAVLDEDVRHLALLDDVDAHRIGRARIAPDDRIVAVGAAGALQGRADHRIARVGEMLIGGQNSFTSSGSSHSASMPFSRFASTRRAKLPRLALVMGEVQHAAVAHHDVVVELAAERLPEVERVLVDRGALVVQVVGADDRRVAAGIAAADPALLDDGDVCEPMLLGEIVGGRQPMPAAADDDGVVARLRSLRKAPGRLPAGGRGALRE